MKYTRFDRARIIGARALQISMGAPSLLAASSGSDALAIAFDEFSSGNVPLNIPRFRDAVD